MRFAGALLLALPLLGLARRKSAQLKRRERLLCAFASFFGRLGALSRWRQETLPALLERLAGEFPDLAFVPDVLAALGSGSGLPAAWGRAARSPAITELLLPAETDVLLAFAAAVSGAAAGTLEEACREASGAFAGFARAAGAERIRQTRLWMGLGAFGALLTVIVLV